MEKMARKFLDFIASPAFLWLTIAWFIFQSIWMAVSTNLGISPDETYHYNLIQLFAKNGWLPFIHNQYGMYSLGEVTHSPFILYHYLLSLPYHFFSGYSHQVILLRFINIGLASVGLYLFIKLANRLRVSKLVRNLSIFLLANTLMYVFLSGSINYDNLLVPISLGSFLALFSVLDNPKTTNILVLLALLFAGCLTAINFLPIALVIFFVLAYKFLPRIKEISNAFTSGWAYGKIKHWFLALICLLLGLLFIQRYGVNLVKYHTYSPSCERVNSYQQCLQDGIFARKSLKRPVTPRPTPFEYASSWSQSMRVDTFGILGHKSISDNKAIRLWSEAFIAIGMLAIARYYKPSRDWNVLLVIGLIYTAILLAQDYLGFLHSGYNFGVQGRYLFTFLPLFYFLANDSLLKAIKNNSIKALFVLASIIIFATAGLPTYILKTTPDWHTPGTVNLNLKIKNHL